jgi:hypothetical protein
MTQAISGDALQLRSMIKQDGTLELSLEAIAVYGKQATGEKYLLNPNKGLA